MRPFINLTSGIYYKAMSTVNDNDLGKNGDKEFRVIFLILIILLILVAAGVIISSTNILTDLIPRQVAKPSPTPSPIPKTQVQPETEETDQEGTSMTSPDGRLTVFIPTLSLPANSEIELTQYPLSYPVEIENFSALGIYGFYFDGTIWDKMKCDPESNYICTEIPIEFRLSVDKVAADCGVEKDDIKAYFMNPKTKIYELTKTRPMAKSEEVLGYVPSTEEAELVSDPVLVIADLGVLNSNDDKLSMVVFGVDNSVKKTCQ